MSQHVSSHLRSAVRCSEDQTGKKRFCGLAFKKLRGGELGGSFTKKNWSWALFLWHQHFFPTRNEPFPKYFRVINDPSRTSWHISVPYPLFQTRAPIPACRAERWGPCLSSRQPVLMPRSVARSRTATETSNHKSWCEKWWSTWPKSIKKRHLRGVRAVWGKWRFGAW